MAKKKSKNPYIEILKQVSAFKKRVINLEKEMVRLGKFERGLTHSEVVLARKIRDMDRIEEYLEKLAHKKEVDKLKKELKKLEKHDDILTENTKFIKELISELGKVKESHQLTRQQVMAREHVSKKDCEARFDAVKEALEDMKHIRTAHKKKASRSEVEVLRKELHERMSQLEYQNKLLMKYLKKVDEVLQEKT